MTDGPKEDRLIGAVLDGRFRLDRLLGSGGMGKVYFGQQLSVERNVAVKVLREELSESESLAQRFFREAKVVASLHHANIVGLVDFGRDPERGLLYIAMEFIDGVSLSKLMARGRLQPALAVAIVRQICSALAQAHAAGVVHRDLKPDNVMLVTTAEGALSVKVLDFGIALPSGEEARLTNTGAVVGTPHYMAPEQAQDAPVTGRSDIYSVGVILYEMACGRLPFVGETPMAVLLKVITAAPPPLDEVLTPDELPPAELVDLIHEMLQKDPAARPSEVGLVADRLDRIANDHQLVAPKITEESDLDAFVVERASDEFALGATMASPVPSAPQVELVQPVARNETAIPPPQKRRRPVALAVVLWVIGGLTCCVVCGGLMDGGGDAQNRAVPVGADPDVSEPSADAGPAAEVTVPSADANHDPLDAAPGPLDAATAPAPSVKEQPSRTTTPTAAAQPPRPSELPPADAHARRMAAGTPCETPTCHYTGTTPPGGGVCDGSEICTGECPAFQCTQLCSGSANCKFNCAAGACTQICSENATCAFSCDGGNCKQSCSGTGKCALHCKKGNCVQKCIQPGCEKTCDGGGCNG